MSAENGVRGVSAAVVGAGAAELAEIQREPEQASMFDLPRGEFVDAGAARDERIQQRGPGRPKGAQNLATRAWREFMLQRGIMPQMEMMRWSMLSPEELAARLQCTRLEALTMLKSLWEGLAPYFMPKLAPTDGAGRVVPPIAMFVGGEGVNVVAEGRKPWEWALPAESEPDQGLTNSPDTATADGASHTEEKP